MTTPQLLQRAEFTGLTMRVKKAERRLDEHDGKHLEAGNAFEELPNQIDGLGKLFMDKDSEDAKRFSSVDNRLDKLEGRMDALEHRMDALEGRMDSLEARMASLESRIESLERTVLSLVAMVSKIVPA